MGELKTDNAKIESVRLGFDRGTILTCWLRLNYGGSGQGYGGYTFDTWDEEGQERVGVDFGTECLRRILQTFEVEQWSDLEGERIRVRYEGNFNRDIKAIGHFMKDQWFSFQEVSDELYPDRDDVSFEESPTNDQ